MFLPETDSCYPAFRQGPCDKGFILVLVKDNIFPQCVKSKCKDGFAELNNKCYAFGESDGCNPKEQSILGVNELFEITCIQKYPNILKSKKEQSPQRKLNFFQNFWNNIRNYFSKYTLFYK